MFQRFKTHPLWQAKNAFMVLVLLVGVTLVGISQVSNSSADVFESSFSDLPPGSSTKLFEFRLVLDESLQVVVNRQNESCRLHVYWLTHELLSSSWSDSPSLVFISDGFTNYSVWIETSSSIDYVQVNVTRVIVDYPLIWAFPLGALTLIGVGLIVASTMSISINGNAASSENVQTGCAMAQRSTRGKWGAFIVFSLFTAVLFLVFTDPGYVHNDSVGGMISGPAGPFAENWEYVASGYLDFSRMVTDNLRTGRFDFQSWAAIHGGSKAIGLSLISGTLAYLTGLDNFLVARLVTIVFSAILAMAVGLLAVKLTGIRGTYALSMFVVLTNPIILEYTRSLYQEVPVSAMCAMALYFLLGADAPHTRNVIAGALCLCLAAAFKSFLVVGPFFLGLTVLLVLNTVRSRSGFKAFLKGFMPLLLLTLLTVAAYFLCYPTQWSNPLRKVLGATGTYLGVTTPGAASVVTNLGFEIVFCFLQTPITVLVFFLVSLWLLNGSVWAARVRVPIVLFLSYFIIQAVESRLVQHHVVLSIWMLILASIVGFVSVIEYVRLVQQQRNQKYLKIAPKVLLSLIVVDLILVTPWLPYTGLYQNPLAGLVHGPRYFEPSYGLLEASRIIRGYTPDGYVMTTASAHVLEYYLGDWPVIYADANMAGSTLSSLVFLESLPVTFFVTSYDFFERQGFPHWYALLGLTGFSEKVGQVASRGLPLVDVFRLNSQPPMGQKQDLLAYNLTFLNSLGAQSLSLADGRIVGLFSYDAKQTGEDWSKVVIQLPASMRTNTAFIDLHLILDGTYEGIPPITIALGNDTVLRKALVTPVFKQLRYLNLACNISWIDNFNSIDYFDRVEICVFYPPVNTNSTCAITIDRIDLYG